MAAETVSASILNHVKADEKHLIAATQRLVQADSQNPPGDVTKAASVAVDLIQKLIPESIIETYETAPGITNVVAIVRSERPGKRLVFSGHLDTYPTGDASNWTVPPLSGSISEDGKRLYGRGAADMKGGIAASIGAVKALVAHKDHWDGEAVIALAGDEETMGTLGSGYLLDNVSAVQCDAMICGDAGSPLVVRIGEKGLIWVELTSTGKPAHGAHVHRGVNAIDRLLRAVDALKSLEQIPLKAQEDVKAVIEAAQPISEPLGGQGERATLEQITVNIGTISGGTSPNLVPDTASAAADIRIPMGISAEDLVKEIHQRLDNFEGISFRVLRSYDPSWTAPSEDIVKLSLAAARSVVGRQAVVNMRVGASDSRLFRKRGIPTVVVGLTPHGMGGADEHLMVEELVQIAQIHTLAALGFLAPAAGR